MMLVDPKMCGKYCGGDNDFGYWCCFVHVVVVQVKSPGLMLNALFI